MTIETYQPASTLLTSSPQSELVAWAQAASAAHQLAVALVKTEFCPVAYRNNPDTATAAILAGAELGLSPLAALRSFDIIQGAVAPRAITLRAVVQAQGHEVWIAKSTESECIARGRRKGSAETQEVRWTTARAQALGLLSKDQWKKQPGTMLVARATAEICRLVASDAILGVPYVIEELDDGAESEPQAATTARRRSSRAAAVRTDTPAENAAPAPLVAVDEPFDDEPAAPAAAVTVEDPPLDEHYDRDESEPTITKAQMGKLQAGFNDCGWTDREDRLRATSAIIGRDITSANDLTKHEASDVIEVLVAAATSPDPQARLAEIVEIASAVVDGEIVP